MDNSPDNLKSNSLEVDEGWNSVRSELIGPPALKSCLPCKYAPVVLFFIVDFVISMYGISYEHVWLCVELLVSALYVRSSAKQEERYSEESDKQARISTIMLGLMIGIILRDIGMHIMLS